MGVKSLLMMVMLYNLPCDDKIERHSILTSRIWINTRVRDSKNYLTIMASRPSILTSPSPPAELSSAWSTNCICTLLHMKMLYNKNSITLTYAEYRSKMDLSLTTGAITKIATRSQEKSLGSLWTNYLILHEDLFEIWATRIELMDQYMLILTWLYSHRIILSKVNKPYDLIRPIVPLSIGRLQLSSGQCLTTIFSIL